MMNSTPEDLSYGTAAEAIELAIARGTFSSESAIISFLCDWYERTLTQNDNKTFFDWAASNNKKRTAQASIDYLLKHEWSGTRRGAGFGYMGSGGNGNVYQACHFCGGLKEANNEFKESEVGHSFDCEFTSKLHKFQEEAK